MATIVLLKTTDAELVGAEADAVRNFLFGHLRGATEKDEKAWRRFIGAMYKAGHGEYFTIKVERRRNTQFHKLVFAVLLAVFKAQESFEDFDLFRSFAKLGAGFADYLPTPDGELRAIPRSQGFAECSEEEIRQFFDDVCAFFRSRRCQSVLWPNADSRAAEDGMRKLLETFDRTT